MHRPTNTWWERNMVCLSADQSAENLLESSGIDEKRWKLEARSILTWKWILEYPDQLWNRVEMRECRQERHKECTQKRSGLELSGQKSAELPDARHARLLVQGSHTLVNARHIKMPGKIAAEQHQRRRRDAELLEIQILDRWTQVRVQQIPTQSDQKQPL